jgi:hypothetical protein
MHGNQNESYINEILQSWDNDKLAKITKINLQVDNLSFNDYNALLLSERFYSYIPTENILIFQCDSMLSDINRGLINDFLKYDYVGSPWKYAKEDPLHNGIGNGGLSLRKKSFSIECIQNSEYINSGLNEDIIFSRYSKIRPLYDDAKRFSIETDFTENSFGIHKAWNYISYDELSFLKTKFIDLDLFMSLQL